MKVGKANSVTINFVSTMSPRQLNPINVRMYLNNNIRGVNLFIEPSYRLYSNWHTYTHSNPSVSIIELVSHTIHIYIHSNPSVIIIELVSHATYVVC